MNVIEFISQPWHWSVSGLGIAVVVFLLLYFGQRFGISTSFATLCTIAGAGRKVSFFNSDWKQKTWLLVFIAGSIIGGLVSSTWLRSPDPVAISEATITDLQELHIYYPSTVVEGRGFIPLDLFNVQSLGTMKGILLMVIGGFFIGFGTRWAGGCTSGHAISGLSSFQAPSLAAVAGFFLGGLAMTHLLFPIIFS